MKLFPVSILFLAWTCLACPAFGQTSWTGGAGDGQFETPGNWSNGVPDAATAAIVTGTSTITINQSTALQNAQTLTIGSTGTVDLNLGAGSTLSITGEVPSNTAQDILIDQGGTLNFAGGTLQLQDGIMIVGDATGTGTFNLNAGSLNFDQQTTPDATQVTIGFGGKGTFTQSGTSSVTTGNILFIGTNGGTGTYTMSGNSTLTTGSNLASGNYFISIGANDAAGQTGTNGTLTLLGNSTLTVGVSPPVGLNPGAAGDLQLGGAAVLFGASGVADGTLGGTGTLIQNGSGTTVNLLAGSTAEIGAYNGGVGIYNLMSGTLNMNNSTTTLGDVTGSTGTLNQSGGTLSVGAATEFDVGFGGQGTYNLSGGSANINGLLIVGNQGGSVGLLAQTGGALVAQPFSFVDIGLTGLGTYTISGGTADFMSTLFVGSTGTVTQTGGALTIELGQQLDLNAVGSVYNLNGGVLKVGNDGVVNGLAGNSTDGTLNFGGGTLQTLAGSSGMLVDALNGTVTGNSTLDTTNGDIKFTGTLTGSGGFTVTGGGNVVLSAPLATYTGPTAINSGSTLVLNVPDLNDTFASGIAGAGQFDVNFAAPNDFLELTGTANFTGTTTLGANGKTGTVEIFNGTFGNIGDNGTVSQINVGGDPAVATSGTVVFTGTNSYTGLTTVNSGFTLFANNLAASLVNDGTVGIYPNTPYVTGTFNIAGNLTSPGTLLVRTNGVSADLYNVTGGADLSNGTVKVSGFGTLATPVTIVTAGGILNTSNLTLTIAGAQVLFTGQVTTDVNNLELTTQQLGTVAFAKTYNQRQVSGALDPLLLHPNVFFITPPPSFVALATSLNNLTAAQIPAALDQLSPESLQYSRNIAIENSSFLAEEMNGVLANLRTGYTGLDASGLSIITPGMESGLGRSLESMVAYNQPAYFESAAPGGSSSSSSGSRTISDSSPPAAASTSSPPHEDFFEGKRISEFIRGDVILADLNQDQGTANAAPTKANYTAANASAGISYRMTSNLAAGILFDYNHTDAKTDASGSKTKVDSYSPGVYGTYFNNGFYVNGLASYGYNTYSNTRNVSFAGLTAKSAPAGNQYVGNLDFGYDFQPEKHWILGPTLGVTYTHLDIDSFKETGAGVDSLAVNSQSVDSVRTRLGGHVIYQASVNKFLLQPNFTAMWQHEYLNGSSPITSQLNVPGTSPFTIETAAPSQDSALLGCGLTASLDNNMALYLNYLADIGMSDYFAQSVEAGFKAKF